MSKRGVEAGRLEPFFPKFIIEKQKKTGKIKIFAKSKDAAEEGCKCTRWP